MVESPTGAEVTIDPVDVVVPVEAPAADVAGIVETQEPAAAPVAAPAPVEAVIEAEVAGAIEVAGAVAQADADGGDGAVAAVAAAQADGTVAGPALALTGPSEAWKVLLKLAVVIMAIGALCTRWGRVV